MSTPCQPVLGVRSFYVKLSLQNIASRMQSHFRMGHSSCVGAHEGPPSDSNKLRAERDQTKEKRELK